MSSLSATVPGQPQLGLGLPLRQVHLDFHTSPHIPDVATEFDPVALARTLKRAHVGSVTIFAKCHHGMCYYPTKTGRGHPAIGDRDLLGEMIEALHREGLRAPIYTTVAWEEDVADRFPQWRQMHADGTFARAANADHTQASHPGGWRFNEWIDPGYQDYIEAHIRELCARYPVDGLFFDILFHAPHAHHSEAALRFRADHDLTAEDTATFRRFEALAQEHFCARFSRLIRGLAPAATLFYNAGLDPMVAAGTGGRARHDHMTHFEIESLPSGFWGYYHFPRLARSVRHWGRPWLGMTGRFQKMWGDFGGIKPQAALEYECFRTQALGGGNSVGDQLPPRGRLDPAAYELIGAVFAQCAAAEPFYAGSEALRHLGLVTACHPDRDLDRSKCSDEGTVQMCEETHYEIAVLDDHDDLTPFAALILPDATVITPTLLPKLRRYYENGGRLILSHHAGRDARGHWALDFLPLTFAGDTEKFPTYWRPRPTFWSERAASDRVIYAQGANVIPGSGTEILVDRVPPYFRRTDLTFCSHFQAPPVAQPDPHPAVVAGERFVYFADPIFLEYRRSGNLIARDIWQRILRSLVGPPPVGDGLPTTIASTSRRRGDDLLVTLLHYIPLRKALEIDVIEERMSFAGEKLSLISPAAEARVFATRETLRRAADGSFELPATKGRLLIEVPGYFAR